MAAPANAAEPDYASPDGTATALAAIDGGLKLTPTDGSGLGTTEVGSATVQIPADATLGVAVAIKGVTLTVGLPEADAAETGVALKDGTVTYDTQTFSSSVVASEQGVQLLTTIAAPTRRPDMSTQSTYPAVDPSKRSAGSSRCL